MTDRERWEEAAARALDEAGFSQAAGVVAVDALWPLAEAKVVRLRAALERAEDFRAEIALDAFTAPDADWDTILDSLRARIRDLGGGIPEDGCYQDGTCALCGGVGCEACDARVGETTPEPARCPTCGSTDRGMMNPPCFDRVDAWHGGETPEPERWTQEDIDRAREDGRVLATEIGMLAMACPTCGSTDRAVLGPLCAIFGRFGAEPDAWHGGETRMKMGWR